MKYKPSLVIPGLEVTRMSNKLISKISFCIIKVRLGSQISQHELQSESRCKKLTIFVYLFHTFCSGKISSGNIRLCREQRILDFYFILLFFTETLPYSQAGLCELWFYLRKYFANVARHLI
jgi:hypothetical protein